MKVDDNKDGVITSKLIMISFWLYISMHIDLEYAWKNYEQPRKRTDKMSHIK